MVGRLIAAVARPVGIALAGVCAGLAALTPAGAVAPRDEQPVLVHGDSFAAFLGRSIADLALYRYDSGTGEFEAVPFQIDERIVDRAFNPGTADEFTETIYDIFGEDDGLLDADDELAFLFGDAGPQAPAVGPWVAGADPDRYEIHVSDPRPGAVDPDRYVYLFAGPGLPVSPTDYVTWTVSATTDVGTTKTSVEFDDRWLMTGYRVLSPCGTGADILDRFKGRAGIAIDQGETEQLWNSTSTFLGGLVGPIRAIRYVQGAASGYNTTHHDVVYRGYWERHFHLRVHNIPGAYSYFDWLPDPAATLYLPGEPAGLAVDGVDDSPSTADAPDWLLYRSSAGGAATLVDIPPSPYYTDTDMYYRDDSDFDDAVGFSYPDDDDSAYGNIGVHVIGVTVGNNNSIYTRWASFALCSDTGDAALGQSYRDLIDMPPGISSTAQSATVEVIQTALARRDGDDLVIEWQAVAGAVGYRVYSSEFPDVPKTGWTALGDTVTTDFRDTGAMLLPQDRYYSVVALSAGGEGDH